MIDSAVETLIPHLLEWIAKRRERAYEQVMNSWRTSCPGIPVCDWRQLDLRANDN